MSVTAPPRPPRPSDPVTHDEFEALVEALIEEARQRARRRRRRYGAVALLVVAAGLVVFIGFGGRGGGGAGSAASARLGTNSPGTSARSPPLGAFPAKMGWTTAFVFDPRNPDTVYVWRDPRTAPRGPRLQDDRWRRTLALDGNDRRGLDAARPLAADPHHPGTLYAGTLVAVYKTVDGGRSWQPWNKGLFPREAPRLLSPSGGETVCVKQPFGTPGTPHCNRGNGWVTALAVDPANTNIVYSGADAVRKSIDGGHSWKAVFMPHYSWSAISALAIAPTRPESIYAIGFNVNTSDSSIYKSTDAGKTWQRPAVPTRSSPSGRLGQRTRGRPPTSDDAVRVDRTHPRPDDRRRRELAADHAGPPAPGRQRAHGRPAPVRHRIRRPVPHLREARHHRARRHLQDDERGRHLDSSTLDALTLGHGGRTRGRPRAPDDDLRGNRWIPCPNCEKTTPASAGRSPAEPFATSSRDIPAHSRSEVASLAGPAVFQDTREPLQGDW